MNLANKFVGIMTLVACLSCGQPARPGLAKVPAGKTTATLAGPACDQRGCECTVDPKAIGTPQQAGSKRFEVKVGPMEHPLWVTVDGAVLYKDAARAQRCFYLDLSAGRHNIAVHAREDSHVGLQLAIAEINAALATKYDTFRLSCGAPGPCTEAEMKQYRPTRSNNLRDPCGSTKVRSFQWVSDRSRDQMQMTALDANFVLDVYDFVPEYASGHPTCDSQGAR